tara:strand:+ start:1687 stop:2406 length:720 start_codon:yes stop_codon:yes gene_type:complete
MKIEIIKCLEDNFSYLLIDEITKFTVVIDPSEAEPIIKKIESLNLKLKFIMNTHHHYDHVGGNKELKKLYNAKVIGFDQDKHRIPGIDISVKNNEIWKDDIFEAKIFHIPGHTLGHICFYFFNENALFSGDTLFSLGCGRVFEGTHEDMFNSLQLIKNLPLNTQIYCGHEYTLKNSDFCLKHDPKNKALISKIENIKSQLIKGMPTIPSTLEEELKTNIFLRSKNVENFSKLRDLKDNF